MKVVDTTTEEISRTSDSKTELSAAQKWLTDIEDGQMRLFTLMKLKPGQQAISELSEFKEYASEAEIKYGIDRTLNWTFLNGNLPLIARSEKDRIVIKKYEEHPRAVVIFT